MNDIKPILSNEDIAEIQSETYRALVAKGYNGGMGGIQWDLAHARAIERAVLEAAPASSAMAMQAVDAPVMIAQDDIVWANIYFKWGQDKVGFGEWSCVVQGGEVKELLNECMGPEWSRKALYAMSDALIAKLFPDALQSQQSPVQASDAGRQG